MGDGGAKQMSHLLHLLRLLRDRKGGAGDGDGDGARHGDLQSKIVKTHKMAAPEWSLTLLRNSAVRVGGSGTGRRIKRRRGDCDG